MLCTPMCSRVVRSSSRYAVEVMFSSCSMSFTAFSSCAISVVSSFSKSSIFARRSRRRVTLPVNSCAIPTDLYIASRIRRSDTRISKLRSSAPRLRKMPCAMAIISASASTPSAPMMSAFIAEDIGDGVPAGRHRNLARTRRNHAGEGRSHFGAESHVAPAAVDEVICLVVDYLLGGLGAVQLARLQDGGAVFLVAEKLADALHVFEQVPLYELILRIKITDSLIAFRREFIALGHVPYYTWPP